MDGYVIPLIVAVTGIVIGGVMGYVFGQKRKEVDLQDKVVEAEKQAETIKDQAQKEAEQILKEGRLEIKDELYKRQRGLERELKRKQKEAERLERRLQHKESQLDSKLENQERLERQLTDKRTAVDQKLQRMRQQEEEFEVKFQEIQRQCEEISGLTRDQAREMLLKSLEEQLGQESAALIRRIEAETKEIADKKARQIITLAIQRCSTEQVSESTVSVVQLPGDDMKGRIIGREGRNIRALETETGCNIIVDDTPEAVVLSCFDPIRREVARLALSKLVEDGRIHPGRIEEVVAKAKKEINNEIQEAGEQAAFELGIHDLHPELIKFLGRLKFRTSYGQNILRHVVEVAQICGMMAAEIGADVKMAKRAALLHDIGKSVSFEMEGPHALVGAELCRKHNEKPAVVHAVAAHHNEEEPKTIIAVLVQASDAVSAARPGARRETLESYIKRLESLEEIAKSFDGVEKAYAIQAGREVRIIAEPGKITDNECVKLARDVTRKIEDELQYPGQIKVTVCRETRAVEYAK
ncbi:ribonuclease Y [Candidatus Sumerlaeota bacterium]|nr:ribonuclease Y [Candidatus Sumerlaeota bacterium]